MAAPEPITAGPALICRDHSVRSTPLWAGLEIVPRRPGLKLTLQRQPKVTDDGGLGPVNVVAGARPRNAQWPPWRDLDKGM